MLHNSVESVIGAAPKFVYSVKFEGHYPVGAVALVVATDGEEAIRLVKNKLFMTSAALAEGNKDLDITSVTVFCQAHDSQITTGKCEILLDGEY